MPFILLALDIGLGLAANLLAAFFVESAVAVGIEVGTAGLLLVLESAAGIGDRVVCRHLAIG